MWIEKICIFKYLQHITAVTDFVIFLIHKMQMLDINMVLNRQPALHLLLNTKPTRYQAMQYTQTLARLFIDLSADPEYIDRYGMSATQYAANHGINLD